MPQQSNIASTELQSFHKYSQMAKVKPNLDMGQIKEQMDKAKNPDSITNQIHVSGTHTKMRHTHQQRSDVKNQESEIITRNNLDDNQI